MRRKQTAFVHWILCTEINPGFLPALTEHTERRRRVHVSHVCRFLEVGAVSSSALSKGVARCRDNLADMALDNPHARERFKDMMDLAA